MLKIFLFRKRRVTVQCIQVEKQHLGRQYVWQVDCASSYGASSDCGNQLRVVTAQVVTVVSRLCK